MVSRFRRLSSSSVGGGGAGMAGGGRRHHRSAGDGGAECTVENGFLSLGNGSEDDIFEDTLGPLASSSQQNTRGHHQSINSSACDWVPRPKTQRSKSLDQSTFERLPVFATISGKIFSPASGRAGGAGAGHAVPVVTSGATSTRHSPPNFMTKFASNDYAKVHGSCFY
jgi:hypothetical protein